MAITDIKIEIQLKTKVRFSVCVFHANLKLFFGCCCCCFKTKQIRFPVPLFLTFRNCKKKKSGPSQREKEKFRVAAAPTREQLQEPLPAVRVSRLPHAGAWGGESGGWSRSREVSYAWTTRDADSAPRRLHPPALLRTRTKARTRPQPATPHTSGPGPGPYRPSAHRHHFGPEPHRSWWRDDGPEPSGGAPG